MTTQATTTESCRQCGTQLAPTMLACPRCARLVHAELLTTLAESAKEATTRGDFPVALTAWREALDLLPAGSRQHQVISAKITQLGQNVPHGAVSPEPVAGQKSPALRVATGAGMIGVMAWKFKALLLGLTKGTTILSMLLSLGVYWTVWGWKFALGLVLSIYVHEMGHVIALRRYGFKTAAPMFIPGIGAIIRLRQQVVNPREDAEIGLAGPIYGLGAAAFSLGLWFATQLPIFAAIAGIGAWINLFNLTPIGSLDGGRGFHAMSRRQKFCAAVVVLASWRYADDGLLMLLALVCFSRALGDKSEPQGDWKPTLVYCSLVGALTAIAVFTAQFKPATT